MEAELIALLICISPLSISPFHPAAALEFGVSVLCTSAVRVRESGWPSAA